MLSQFDSRLDVYLHLMHSRLGCPSSKLLTVEVERNRAETP